MSKTQGKCSYWNVAKRYGFIKPDSGDDVFIHDENCLQDVCEGDRVAFLTRPSRTKAGKFEAFDCEVLVQSND